MATLKPTTPLLASNKGALKPASPLHPKNCTKNAHFSPAKAMTVSIPRERERAKVTAVSDKALPAPAKAMAVSDNRPSWPTGPGGGTHGRWRGLAGLRDDAPSEARSADDSRAGRRPPAHTAAGPSGARNTRGYTQQPGPAGHTQQPAPAGGRGLRRPEHQRRNMPPRHNKTARPHRGRAAQSVSKAQRRITTMSGSPRPLSWRTLEIPSLEATSFAVPSMRGSS